MDYDKTTNKITFVVPNKTHIIITYDVKIDVDPIDNPLWYLNTNNTVQVEIFATNRKNSSVSFSDDAAAIKVWAYDTNGDITIYKYWNNGGTMTALPGATFRLYSVYDNNGHTYTEADADYIIRDDITITESDGKINITGLPLDRIYRLEEVSAPDGYSKGEDYYFVLQGHYGVTIPEALADKDIALYTSGDIIRYENKKSGSLIITKTINGDITASEVLDKISFKVTDSTGKTVKEFKLSDKKVVYDENSGKFIMKLEGLDSGTYTVEETAENADGKKVTVRYTVAGGSESSADDTENEPVLWQAGNKAAGVSVREGEETEVDFENTYESVTIATEPDASTTTTTEVTTTEITTTEVTTTEIVTTEVDTPGEDTTEVTTERTDTPSTGDSAPLMPIIIIFFVSWAAGATLIVLKRKHIK
jgi:hypothetical protein